MTPNDVPLWHKPKPPKTLEEIGQILGMSRRRVHQIEQRALKKIAAVMAGSTVEPAPDAEPVTANQPMSVDEAKRMLPVWCSVLGIQPGDFNHGGRYMPRHLVPARKTLYAAMRIDGGMSNADVCRVLRMSQNTGCRIDAELRAEGAYDNKEVGTDA